MSELKEGRETSMPHWLDFPIKTREDFRKNLYRWELNFEEAVPEKLERQMQALEKQKSTAQDVGRQRRRFLRASQKSVRGRAAFVSFL